MVNETVDPMFQESSVFYWHKLLLDPDIDTIFHGFHKSCVQRKIRRAIRERLEYTEGRSDRLIRQFHKLLILTQQRHCLPPQPIAWFQNLSDCLGEQAENQDCFQGRSSERRDDHARLQAVDDV